MKPNGFTLAELLIALLILGVIATFTIPKILTAQQDSRQKAVFRESYAALYQVFYEGLQTGRLTPSMTDSQVRAYFRDNLNAVKVCTQETTQGCCTGGMAFCHTESAVVLHNGATIYSIDYATTGPEAGTLSPVIDVNGPGGPNTEGQDVLILMLVLGTTPVNGVSQGRIAPWPFVPTNGSSVTLYNTIFSN